MNKRKLYKFQEEGVRFIENNNGKVLIADEMGLGKTIQALAYLKRNLTLRPCLIVVPSFLAFNWESEVKKWLGEEVFILTTKTKNKKNESKIIIVSYDSLHNFFPFLIRLPFLSLILDEVHYIRNPKTKRTRSIKKLVRVFSFKSVIALSGTPIVNKPIEFFPVLNLLVPKLFSSWWDFVKRYCDPKHNGFGWSYSGATNKMELNNILTKTIMLRRLKKDVLPDLPPKTYSTVLLSLDNYTEYRSLKKDLFSLIKANKKQNLMQSKSLLAKLQELRFSAANSKLKASISWIKTFMESGNKLVLFCYHNFFIEQFVNNFKGISVSFCGKTSLEDRNKAVKEFQNNPRIKLFIGGIKSAGVGITLTKATNLCFFETTWSSGDMFQAEDRIHRIGSVNPVTIWYLIAKGTIEEQIIRVLRRKTYVLKEILDGEKNNNNIYSDILDLLMRRE